MLLLAFTWKDLVYTKLLLHTSNTYENEETEKNIHVSSKHFQAIVSLTHSILASGKNAIKILVFYTLHNWLEPTFVTIFSLLLILCFSSAFVTVSIDETRYLQEKDFVQ